MSCIDFTKGRTLHAMETWDNVLAIEDNSWCKEVINNSENAFFVRNPIGFLSK